MHTNRLLTLINPPARLRRLGWAGFAFFLIKGLLWLALPIFVQQSLPLI